MTKQELTNQVAAISGYSRETTKDVIESMMTVMSDTFTAGHNIYLRGFGTFKVRETKPRKARNIRSGEMVIVPARKNVKFAPCEELKKRLHGQ